MTTPDTTSRIIKAMAGGAILGGLYLTSLSSFLLFHTFIELFCILVAFGMFVIAWNARETMENDYLLFIGIGYLFVGVFDALHTLTYKNMIDLAGFTADLPTQLWIAGRYLQCCTIVCAPVFLDRRINHRAVLCGFAGVSFLVLASIFYWRIFPSCFIEGTGLTQFKVASEYVICALLALSMVTLQRRRKSFDPSVWGMMTWSLGFFICAEMAFTLYTDVYGFSNMVGHLFKLITYFLVYKAMIETGLKRPYALMHRNLKESEANLALRARELEAANKELEAFNYTVSHDLRAPLSNINGSCQVLLQLSNDLGDDSKEFVGYINKEVGRMGQLISTLLQFSLAGRQALHRQEIDLTAMAKEIAAQLRQREPERNVDVRVQEGITLNGDRDLLNIVLGNLVGNAWKYTGKKECARIEIGVIEDTGRRICYVRDTGAGFDMEQSHKLFETFQRLHRSEFDGLGIGLATAERIIHRHGGEIWAEGAVGEGATFFFTTRDSVTSTGVTPPDIGTPPSRTDYRSAGT